MLNLFVNNLIFINYVLNSTCQSLISQLGYLVNRSIIKWLSIYNMAQYIVILFNSILNVSIGILLTGVYQPASICLDFETTCQLI